MTTKQTDTHFEADEQASVATPDANKVRLYAKTDGRYYSKDDAGAEAGPFGAAAGGSQHVIRENGTGLTARTGLNFVAGLIATDDAGGDESEVALDYATTEIVDVAAAEGAGTSDKVPRADHAHAVPNDLITNAMLANVGTQTFKGRTTAATGDSEDLTATQATAILNAMVGDAGAGGTKGLVPAPAAGDTAAGKYLKADGAWTVPPGGGSNHNLLDGSVHPDTLADTVTDGDIIIGNVTPKWSSLAISVPAANVLNVLSVAFGELRASWKALFDATNPAALGTAAPGTSLIADHVHLDPVTAHEAASDPHTGYVREADPNWTDLTDSGATTLHSHAGGSALTVQEEDGTPIDTAVSVIRVPNGGLIDNGVGDVSLGYELAGLNATHLADAADAHDASAISILDTAADFTATDVEGALAELQADAEAHAAAADPHTAYALDTDLSTHASAADPHTGYVLESLIDAAGDLIQGSAADTVARLAISVPAANILNVLGVAFGETVTSWKAIHDATNPAALGTAAPGTSLLASHRDHVHLDPVTAHVAAGDPHTGYRLESADHSHASAGAQGGTILLSDTTVSGLTDGQVLKATGATTKAFEDDVAAIEFIIDGGGSAITTGQKGHLEIPFACVITRVTTLADQTGSIVVDIWKDTYANFPPTVTDTITASAKPTLASAQKAQDSTLTGWTTAIAAGDILAYNVDSATTVTRVVISLKVRKT
jgi:hypothetical protein